MVKNMIKRLIDFVMGRDTILLNENERALWLYKGEVQGLLGPGEHRLKRRNGSTVVEIQKLNHKFFDSDYEQAVMEKLPLDVAEHLMVVRTSANEIAIIERDNIIDTVLGADGKLILWKDAGPWTVKSVDIGSNARIDDTLLKRLQRSSKTNFVSMIEVDEGKIGLVYIDGKLTDQLTAGVYGYWSSARKVTSKLIDMSRQSIDVAGQEILTRDRVTLRINIAAEYRVVDPVLAVTSVKLFDDALYRALQYAFRKTLGALTLDQILKNKVSVDKEAADKVRTDMAAIGLEVTEIALKDVILPGDMRDILNQVVAAQKEAEANVIRRREETNATRSLLNTAKVMAENPVMLRLKEMEALENIAGKVERLTIHNGTAGLLNDIVNLSEK